MLRIDERRPEDLRPVFFERGIIRFAEGSVLVTMGDTKVICTASIEKGVPPFRRGTGKGWVTAEYGMIPRSTPSRTPREASRGRQGGRSLEIQRLIGRCLRSVVDLDTLGERTIWVDCDVIQADGGTRTASVNGAFIALVEALQHLRRQGDLAGAGSIYDPLPVSDFLAAVSVGLVDDQPLLDLNFFEDSQAQVDMNVAATAAGRMVEVQGTGESNPFERRAMVDMIDLAMSGIERLVSLQRSALGELAELVGGRDGR